MLKLKKILTDFYRQCKAWFHIKNSDGFSLLEVIIAFAVLTIAILGATSILVCSSKLNEHTHLRSIALFGAMQSLDTIMIGINPRNNLPMPLENMDGQYFPITGLSITTNPPDASIEVGRIEVTQLVKAYVVKITVTWTSPNTKANSAVSLSTVLFNP